MRRVRPIAVALFVLSAPLVLSACRQPSEPRPGEARLSQVRGRVEVSRDGRAWRRADGGLVRSGELVRARGATAHARLELTRGGALELRDRSRVRVGATFELLAGDLLVRAGRSPVRVASDVADTVVGTRGSARLSRSLAFDAGAYRGSLRVTSAGRSLRVPALRQATVPGTGLVSDRPSPLRYHERDPWDREFLIDAIELGRDLDARSRGLTGQLGPGQGTTPGFLRLVLPELSGVAAATDELLVDAPPVAGERIVGSVISLTGRRGSFASRWRDTFGFRADGAEWGLVALDQQIAAGEARDRLVSQIDAAVARAAVRPELAAPAPPPTEGVSTTGPATPVPTTSETPPSRPAPTPSTSIPPPAVPPTSAPTVPPILTVPTLPPPNQEAPNPAGGSGGSTDGVLGQLTDPLVDAVGGVLDGLLGNPPPPPA